MVCSTNLKLQRFVEKIMEQSAMFYREGYLDCDWKSNLQILIQSWLLQNYVIEQILNISDE